MSEIDELTGNPIDSSAEFDFETFTLKAIEALKNGEPLPRDSNVIWMNPEEVTIEQLQESLVLNQIHQANQEDLKETLAIQQEEYQQLVESGEISKFIVPPGAFPPVPKLEPLPPEYLQIDADTIINIQSAPLLEQAKAGISLEDFPLDSPERQAFLEAWNVAKINNFILPPGAFPPVSQVEPLPPEYLQIDNDVLEDTSGLLGAPGIEPYPDNRDVKDTSGLLGSPDIDRHGLSRFLEAFIGER